MRFHRLAGIGLTLVVLLALQTLPAQAGILSRADEINIGREASKEVEQEYGLYQDAQALELLQKIGFALVTVGEDQDFPYSFKILDTEEVNALAAPGGFIYATKGLMDMVTPQELTFVMAHELAHVTHHHVAKQIEQNLWTNIGLVVIAGALGGGLNFGEGTQNTLAAASMVLNNSYSRTDEKDADLTGLRYMAAAGVNPVHALGFMEKLQKMGQEVPQLINDILGDHPLDSQRLAYMKDEIEKIDYNPTPAMPLVSLADKRVPGVSRMVSAEEALRALLFTSTDTAIARALNQGAKEITLKRRTAIRVQGKIDAAMMVLAGNSPAGSRIDIDPAAALAEGPPDRLLRIMVRNNDGQVLELRLLVHLKG